MKKLLKIFFAIVLVLGFTNVDALSGTNTNTKGTITIDNAEVGKTYTAYQVLKLESFDQGKAYAYVINTNWETFVTTGEGKDYLEVNELGYVSWKASEEDSSVAAFAKAALNYANTVNNDSDETNNVTFTAKTASSSTVVFDELNLGYYLIDSSLGALCSLNTTDPTTTIKEKNSAPTVDKTVKENGTYGKTNDASIGDTVEFKTVITVGKGSQNYKLHDTMSTGLTLNDNSFVVTAKKADSTAVNTEGGYTVKETPDNKDTFTIEFTNTLVEAIGEKGTIEVTYTATLNSNAVISGEGNPNNTSLDYGDNHNTTSTPTKTYTYSFDVVKTKTSKEVLNGAEFNLLDVNNNIIKVVFVKEENGVKVYKVAEDKTVTSASIQAGVARIEGLDSGTYYLNETKIPDGYNRLAKNPSITINAANNHASTEYTCEAGELNEAKCVIDEENTVDATLSYVNGGLQVINYTGTELPSTGGAGTTLFITIGTLMVLGFGLLLTTKLRMSKISM